MEVVRGESRECETHPITAWAMARRAEAHAPRRIRDRMIVEILGDLRRGAPDGTSVVPVVIIKRSVEGRVDSPQAYIKYVSCNTYDRVARRPKPTALLSGFRTVRCVERRARSPVRGPSGRRLLFTFLLISYLQLTPFSQSNIPNNEK